MDPKTQLIQKYLPSGRLSGSELLLPPVIALEFIKEVADLGLIIWGVDVWDYVTRDGKIIGVHQRYWEFLEISNDVVYSDYAVEQTSQMAIEYVQSMKESCDFVYVDFYTDITA